MHYIIIHSLSIFFPVLFSLALSLFYVSVFLSVSPTLVIIGSNQDIQYPLLSHYIAELAKLCPFLKIPSKQGINSGLLKAKIVLVWNILGDSGQDLLWRNCFKTAFLHVATFIDETAVCLSQWTQEWPQRSPLMREAAIVMLQWRIYQLPSRLSSELSGELLLHFTFHISGLLAGKPPFKSRPHLQTCMQILISGEKLK